MWTSTWLASTLGEWLKPGSCCTFFSFRFFGGSPMRFEPLRMLLALCFACLTAASPAQSTPTPQANRSAAHPDFTATARLAGHVPSWASPDRDQGQVPDTLPLHLTFVLTRSADRQAAFTQLLADQQNTASPSYHHWLTPQQVGELYGPTQADLDTLTAWLGSRGLTVVDTAPSRIFLHAVAPASVVASAFVTGFHFFSVNGESHLATTADPQLPTALLPLIGSIAGLADTPIQPANGSGSVGAALGGPHPDYTSASSGNHFVTPADFALIFDLQPTYLSGFTGTGQKIAIIGRSRVVSTDISEYQTNTNLAANLPNTIIPPTGVDPGITGNGDQTEATLDVDRVLGTAPAASVDLVVSGTAGGLNGIYIAAQYNVQTLLDPVMNVSFGSCEVLSGPSGVSLWDTLFAQAASEGISVFVSAADSGAATCDTQFATPPAYQFRSINYICASSYATCVGGTEFAEGTNTAQYWSATNGTGLASALSYIPEGAWNEPTSSTVSNTTYVAASGGGGASLYIPKPSWQTGTGVPADGVRDVPDVSFPASAHDGYYACYAAGNGDCAAGRYEYFYGTSAAAPAMAAVTALLNQKSGHSQGNLNPLLYRIAASTPSAFHDATPASSGIGSACSTLVPSLCNNSTPGVYFPTGGLAGFDLTTGYDQATGLGSLDITNFLNAASAITATSLAHGSLALTETASTIADTQTDTFTAAFTSTTAGTSTGTVQFFANGTSLGAPIALTSGRAITSAQPFPAAGTYLITAAYSGDTNFAAATAPGISLTVTGLASQSRLTLASTSIPVGTSANLSVTVTFTSGSAVPSGLVRFYSSALGYLATVPLVNGSATIPNTFSTVGTSTLTAYYLGDSVFSPSSSPSMTYTVQKLQSTPQVNLTSSSVGLGGFVTLTASLPYLTPSSAPFATGTIQLLDNGLPLGLPLTLSGGVASLTQVFQAAGTQTITASYSGDTYWATSSGGAATLTVLSTPASYALFSSTPTLTLTAGAPSGNTLTVGALGSNGFVGSVTLACTVAYNGTGIAANPPACVLSPSLVAVTLGSSPPISTVTLTSTAAHIIHANPVSRLTPESSTRLRQQAPRATLFAALLLGLLPFRRRRSWSARTSLLSALVLTALFAALTGCGGGGSSSSPTPTPVPGTTPGSYTITITASTTNPGTPVPTPATIALTIQ